MPAFFISDLHLCRERPATNRLCFDFLAGPARRADALYILGDLFEYWAGDDGLDDPFNAEVCAALRGLSQGGVAAFFMAGNRDFLVGLEFARAAGLTTLAEPARLDLAGKPTLLLHGDSLCTDDAQYQAFRAQVRSPDWQRSFLAQPLTERKAQIEALRRESAAQKRVKPIAIMDVNGSAVAEILRTHGCTRLIHGHTHRPALHVLEVDGRRCERWVLADWYEGGSYLECGTTGCRSVALP